MDLLNDYPFLTKKWQHVYKAYGREAFEMLGNARNEDDLGINFGATLTQKEVEWLIGENLRPCRRHS